MFVWYVCSYENFGNTFVSLPNPQLEVKTWSKAFKSIIFVTWYEIVYNYVQLIAPESCLALLYIVQPTDSLVATSVIEKALHYGNKLMNIYYFPSQDEDIWILDTIFI